MSGRSPPASIGYRTFAENVVRELAHVAAKELAGRVTLTMVEGSNAFEVRCGTRSVVVRLEHEHDAQARLLERAVEVVMGLREPEPTP